MAVPYLISLADVRAHLQIPTADTSWDDQLQNTFIPAVADIIKNECGDVMPYQYDEYYDGGTPTIWLHHPPVLSILSIQEGWGYTNYELDYVQVNATAATSMFAYSLDQSSTGQITRRSGGNVAIPFVCGDANIRVTYLSGRNSVPGGLKLAALELVAHYWRNSQQRLAQAPATGYDAVDMDQPGSGPQGGLIGLDLGIPEQVIELLRPYRHMPFIG
jgi:hypothetical protein